MIQYDLPFSEYLTSPGFGSSIFRKLLDSPAEFKAAQRKAALETRATTLGTAIHAFILEPSEFIKRYALQPEDWGARNKGDGYKRWNEFKTECEASGKIPVNWEDAQLLRDIDDAAGNVPQLSEQLTFGRSEVSAFAQIDFINFKARVDLVGSRVDDGMTPCFWDLKTTTEDITDDSKLFGLIRKYRYDFQAAHYLEVYNEAAGNMPHGGYEYVEDFGWIFISTNKAAPVVRMVQAPEELLRWGKSDFRKACDLYNHCSESGNWYNVNPIVTTLPIPQWAYEKYGEPHE